MCAATRACVRTYQEEVIQALRRVAPHLHVHKPNSSATLAQQLRPVATADVVVSLHGAHAASVAFMRPGATFVELFPWQFYYALWPTALPRCGVRAVALRDNGVEVSQLSPLQQRLHAKVMRKVRQLESDPRRAGRRVVLDTSQQGPEHRKLRIFLRGLPVRVNVPALEATVADAVTRARAARLRVTRAQDIP